MRRHEEPGIVEGRVLSGSVLGWQPQGAEDFAQLATVVAGVLGNGPGIQAVSVFPGRYCPTVQVQAASAEYVRAAAFGPEWELYEVGDTHLTAWGSVCGVRVSVSWSRPRPRQRWGPAA